MATEAVPSKQTADSSTIPGSSAPESVSESRLSGKIASSAGDQAPGNPLEGFGTFFTGFMTAASSIASNVTASVATVDPMKGALSSSADVETAGLSEDALPEPHADMNSANETSNAFQAPWRQSLHNGEDTATHWLSNAGKLWDSAVKDVGERLEAAQLDKKVGSLRESSTNFLADVSKNIHTNLHNIDGTAIRQRADMLETSAKGLLFSASEQIQSKTKEALEIFVDKDSSGTLSTTANSGSDVLSIVSGRSKSPENLGPAPWDAAALPESERIYADALREEMLKLVLESIYTKKRRSALFLSGCAAKHSFVFNTEENVAQALAVLEADKNVRRLRSGLVPQKISEQEFWNEYFYQVQRIRHALVENNGRPPDANEDDVDVDDVALFDDEDDEEEEIAPLDAPVKPPQRKQAWIARETDLPPAVLTIDGAGSSLRTNEEATANTVAKSPVEGRDWENEIDALFDSKDNA